MNGALIGLIKDFIGAGDITKRRDEDWKHQADVRAAERAADEAQRLKEKGEKDVREVESAEYNKRFPVKANTWEQYQKTGQLYSPTSDDFLHRPTIANSMELANMRLQSEPIESQQKYNELRARAAKEFDSVRGIIAPKFQGTSEQGSLVFPSLEGSNALQTNTGLEGIRRGVPAVQTDTNILESLARQALANKSRAENEALLKNAGRTALAQQNLSFLGAQFGGQTPSAALLNPEQKAFVHISPDSEIEVKMNPFHSRINPDPMAQFGPDAGLKAAAEGLGMERYPMRLDTSGNAIRPPTPARQAISAGQIPSGRFGAGVVTPGPAQTPIAVPRGYEGYRGVLSRQPDREIDNTEVMNQIQDQNLRRIIQQYEADKRNRGTRLMMP